MSARCGERTDIIKSGGSGHGSSYQYSPEGKNSSSYSTNSSYNWQQHGRKLLTAAEVTTLPSLDSNTLCGIRRWDHGDHHPGSDPDGGRVPDVPTDGGALLLRRQRRSATRPLVPFRLQAGGVLLRALSPGHCGRSLTITPNIGIPAPSAASGLAANVIRGLNASLGKPPGRTQISVPLTPIYDCNPLVRQPASPILFLDGDPPSRIARRDIEEGNR